MDVTTELTIVIPVRIDCDERRNNLDSILSLILQSTGAFVIILEADIKQRYIFKEQDKRVEYIYTHDNNNIFHRTHYINNLIKMTTTNIVGIWDTDIFLATNQIKNAVNLIKNGTTLCYPYDGCFMFLDEQESVRARSNISSFLNLEYKSTIETHFAFGRPSVGGAFIVNRERYLELGGENETFYGWGPEDAERLKRMEILQETIERTSGPLFHLYHPRRNNSTFSYNKRVKNNLNELIKMCNMNTIEMQNYIDTWKWRD